MEPNSLVTFSVCFIILMMILFVIGYFLVQWGVKQLKKDRINKAEYEKMYLEIQKHIENYSLDLSSYYKIKKEIWRLKNLKWKNHEKTAGINTELCFGRFLDIALSERKKRIDKNC